MPIGQESKFGHWERKGSYQHALGSPEGSFFFGSLTTKNQASLRSQVGSRSNGPIKYIWIIWIVKESTLIIIKLKLTKNQTKDQYGKGFTGLLIWTPSFLPWFFRVRTRWQNAGEEEASLPFHSYFHNGISSSTIMQGKFFNIAAGRSCLKSGWEWGGNLSWGDWLDWQLQEEEPLGFLERPLQFAVEGDKITEPLFSSCSWIFALERMPHIGRTWWKSRGLHNLWPDRCGLHCWLDWCERHCSHNRCRIHYWSSRHGVYS